MTASALQQRVLTASRCAPRVAVAGLEVRRPSRVHAPAPASSLPPRRARPSPPPAGPGATGRRLFHPTPARGLFDTPGEVLLCCLGVASGWVVASQLHRTLLLRRGRPADGGELGSLPPASWILAPADPDAQMGVFAAIEAGFNMARATPEPGRQEALREATFRLPHEVAQLNKDAPEFEVADMGPVPPIPEDWFDGLDPVFDPQKDARVFLYFPTGAAKAAAGFVAINAELEMSDMEKDRHVDAAQHANRSVLFGQALASWICWYMTQGMEKSGVTERIEPGKLPIIFFFRENTNACVFDTEEQTFHDPSTMRKIIGLADKA